MSLSTIPVARDVTLGRTDDPILGYMLGDVGSFAFRAFRERLRRQTSLVTAYATADPIGMFSPDLHEVSLKAAGELQTDYSSRVKFARALTSRILDSRIQGCAALPVAYTPSAPVDMDRVLERLSLTQIQTVTECSGTSAVRPIFDPATGSVFYQIFGADEIAPYVGAAEDFLVGLAVERDGIREFWTETSFEIREGDKLLAAGLNPWGEIPFAIFRTRRHPRLWWGINDLASPVVNNIAINKLASDLLQLAAEQSFAIYVVYEEDDGSGDYEPAETTDDIGDASTRRAEFNWTSGQTVFVPHKGKVETISPKADIRAIAETIKLMGKHTLDDAYIVDVSESQAGQSGFSLKVRTQPYLNKARAIRREFKPGVARLLELALLVEYAGRNRLAYATRIPGFAIRVDFDETPLTPIPVDEDIRRSEYERKIGAESTVGYLMRTRTLSREEAEALASEIAEDDRAGRNGPSSSATVNDKTLGAQRFGSVGDVDGFNVIRRSAFEDMGIPAPPDVSELKRPAPEKGDETI